MAIDFRISSLQFSGSSDPIHVADSDLVVLIGPNNAGKSRALRELDSFARNGQLGGVLTDVTVERVGNEDELLTWFAEVSAVVEELDAGSGFAGPVGFVSRQNVTLTWTHAESLGPLANFLVKLVDAEGRLQLAARGASIGIRNGVPVTPLQRLLRDMPAEQRLSEAVQSAFGQPVALTRAGGAELELLLGSTSADAQVTNQEYLDQLLALPAVEEQGDGMRSFIGLLLTLIAMKYRLVLIDEPEAFLHPPQARELGRQLGALGNGQRFIATHSSDVLLGLLEQSENITIIRLRRESNSNVPAVLGDEKVRELWSDPSFRYSNLLDGLFHSGVVVCEADGDATLYEAALDAEREELNLPAADILFTQCGGKQKMPIAIGALKPMGVPIAVILDIDALRDSDLLKRIVDALGGDWEAMAPDWQVVSAAVTHVPVDAPTVESVQGQIEAVLGDDPTAPLKEEQTRRIREITRSRDGWRRVREAGISGLPAGGATAAANRLVASLSSVGAFIVSEGQLEGWDREIGGHGPKFVAAALSAGVHRTPEIRKFVASAAAFLGAHHNDRAA